LCDAESKLPIKFQSFEIAKFEYFVSDYLPLDVDRDTERYFQEILLGNTIYRE